MAKSKGMKRAIPRHRHQVAASAARQERAIEKAERQKARREIERDRAGETGIHLSQMLRWMIGGQMKQITIGGHKVKLICSLMPSTDARAAEVMARISEPAVAAR